MVRLGTSRAAVGSAALQCHSLSLTRQGCSVPMMLAAAADALTAFATCTHKRHRGTEPYRMLCESHMSTDPELVRAGLHSAGEGKALSALATCLQMSSNKHK